MSSSSSFSEEEQGLAWLEDEGLAKRLVRRDLRGAPGASIGREGDVSGVRGSERGVEGPEEPTWVLAGESERFIVGQM